LISPARNTLTHGYIQRGRPGTRSPEAGAGGLIITFASLFIDPEETLVGTIKMSGLDLSSI
jgi:hypothetical protein